MHFVLKEKISQALQSEDFLTKVGAPAIVPPFNFQVEEPTDRQFGFLASNVAFICAKKMKEVLGIGVSPFQIASALKECLGQSDFALRIDGGGFLNADPTAELIERFLRSDDVPLPLMEIFWDSNALHQVFSECISDEPFLFLQEVAARGQVALSHRDSLQLLSLLGDSELEALPYLRGYGGRSNTPAYLEGFLAIVKRLSSREVTGFPVLDEQQRFMEKVLLYRGRVMASLEGQHFERILRYALELVREFYSLYNRPDYRAALLLLESDLLWQNTFSALALKAGKYVDQTLNLLKFSCEVPNPVLNRN